MQWIKYTDDGNLSELGVGDNPPTEEYLPTPDGSAIDHYSHYVFDGELVAYSEIQRRTKEARKNPYSHWSNVTMQWEDPRTLQDLKDAKWATIKQARSQAEYAGFTWDGSTFDSDATSQNRITGAVTLAVLSPSFTIDWILADNSTRLLNQADMMQVGAALGLHVASQFAKGVTLRAQIEAATTQAEVEAVVW